MQLSLIMINPLSKARRIIAQRVIHSCPGNYKNSRKGSYNNSSKIEVVD